MAEGQSHPCGEKVKDLFTLAVHNAHFGGRSYQKISATFTKDLSLKVFISTLSCIKPSMQSISVINVRAPTRA
jgi:hypothetical protein